MNKTTDKQIEALKLALEALKKCDAALAEELAAWDIDPPLHHVLEASNACGPAITAIREALAEQPAQQQGWKLVPVQPTDEMRDAGNAIIGDRGALFAAYRAMLNAAPQPAQQEPVITKNEKGLTLHVGWDDLPAGTKLYTSPPANANAGKPWVGLTEEERDAILDREFKQWWSRHDAVCRAIEAKLREKNT